MRLGRNEGVPDVGYAATDQLYLHFGEARRLATKRRLHDPIWRRTDWLVCRHAYDELAEDAE